MKTLYLIRHAKSKWDETLFGDYERSISKRGKKDLITIGSYLAIEEVKPDLILSSCALRAQQTVEALASRLEYEGKIFFLEELYQKPTEALLEIIQAQESNIQSLCIIGHNPQLQELANNLLSEHIAKLPTLGVIAIELPIEQWSDIEDVDGVLQFFIYPKQFRYYLPRKIRNKMLKQ
jgi:phosphohistidine phosphatase